MTRNNKVFFISFFFSKVSSLSLSLSLVKLTGEGQRMGGVVRIFWHRRRQLSVPRGIQVQRLRPVRVTGIVVNTFSLTSRATTNKIHIYVDLNIQMLYLIRKLKLFIFLHKHAGQLLTTDSNLSQPRELATRAHCLFFDCWLVKLVSLRPSLSLSLNLNPSLNLNRIKSTVPSRKPHSPCAIRVLGHVLLQVRRLRIRLAAERTDVDLGKYRFLDFRIID